MTVVQAIRPRVASRWQSFESWVGTRSSAAALVGIALVVFALQSVVLPAHPGRDMGRYVQAYLQLGQADPILPSVLAERGPLAALGVGVPLDLGGAVAEVWLALLYAVSILAWARVAMTFGPRAAVLTSTILLAYPGYGLLFHELASDALFAAGFAVWAVALSRAVLRPSIPLFLFAGLGMGLLVLVRPANQVFVVFALLPLVLRAPWGERARWTASFFIGSAIATQGWKAFAAVRWESLGLRPSGAVLLAAGLLSLAFVPVVWRRRLALAAVPAAVVVAAVFAPTLRDPVDAVRSAAQAPSITVFLFRVFEMDRIVSPDNGPASERLGEVVRLELLAKEPYLSYGVTEDAFFSSGSDRIFQDLQALGGMADLGAVTREAIAAHPWEFVRGIAGTAWDTLWTRRIYAEAGAPAPSGGGAAPSEPDTVVIEGRTLPRPTEGQPIPSSRIGRTVVTNGGVAREVWISATEHPIVFENPSYERRWKRFEEDTARLADRIPTRNADAGLVHRLNQASRAFPPPLVWLVLGLAAVAIRRPRRALAVLAPAAAGLALVVATALVAFAVAHYAAPVTPAFILLTAAGLVGEHPRGKLRLRRRSERSDTGAV